MNAPSASQSGTLGNGGSGDGTIGIVGDIDRWDFSASEGELVRVQLGELSGTVFNPLISVR